jgi:uncharacterized membrane protein YgdD (TMEM256/DUF423 family)
MGAVGAVLGALGVAAGAFGAHALRHGLAPAMLEVFETATRYQLVHALAMVVTALAFERRPSAVLAAAGWLFGAGVVLFSGSLYALSLVGPTWWGIVTPFGGVSFLAGWTCLAFGLGRDR